MANTNTPAERAPAIRPNAVPSTLMASAANQRRPSTMANTAPIRVTRE
jgi:hypothetical protein